ASLDVRTVITRTKPGHYVLKEFPKNDFRRRTIELPRQLVEVLRFHLLAAPESDFVFPNSVSGQATTELWRPPTERKSHREPVRYRGRPLSYRNFRRDVFDKAVARSGMDLTFGDLRKTHVAWLIDAGWSEARIVRRMGWKDGRMLHTTYGPRLEKRQRDEVSGLEEGWPSETPILPSISDDSRPVRGLRDPGRESGAV
ncbi:MAG TPA: tyrosine-type recombinase/integrase, partial [Actinomycetota bacterium]|nr:tyrosine-type recombinase/integrase [Actinomycetota bacterium]